MHSLRDGSVILLGNTKVHLLLISYIALDIYMERTVSQIFDKVRILIL